MNIINKFITTNFTKGRQGHVIKQITPHTAVATARSLFNWFNTSSTRSSTHFYVNNLGEIEQYVGEENAAWSNSNWNRNLESVTFETWDNKNPNDSVRTDALYESSAQLVAYLSKKYNIPLVILTQAQALAGERGITLHKYFIAKSCPAGLNVQRIIDRAKQILSITNFEMITLDQEITLKAIHTKDPFNIRSQPTSDSTDIGDIPQGFIWKTKRVALGQSVYGEQRWYGIINNQGQEGWASAKYIQQLPTQADCSVQEARIRELEVNNQLLTTQNQQLQNEINSFVPETIYRKR